MYSRTNLTLCRFCASLQFLLTFGVLNRFGVFAYLLPGLKLFFVFHPTDMAVFCFLQFPFLFDYTN